MKRLIADLNGAYVQESALHALDADSAGFQWIIGDDRSNSIYVFCRGGYEGSSPEIGSCNFTPVPRLHYQIGAPRTGRWREIINTDADIYGGSNLGNGGTVWAEQRRSHGQPFSIELTVPPLATLWLRFDE